METYTRHNYTEDGSSKRVDIFTTERNALIALGCQDEEDCLSFLGHDDRVLCSSKPSYTVLTGCTSTISNLTAITCSRSVSSIDLLYNRRTVGCGGNNNNNIQQPQVFSSMSLAKSFTKLKWSPKDGESQDCFVQGDMIHVPRIRSLEKAPVKIMHHKDIQTDGDWLSDQERQQALIRYLQDVGSKFWYFYDKCCVSYI